MSLQIYNSLTKKIELFKPLKDGEVSMYVCGITPDAATHLGHAFTYMTFDVLVRLLSPSGYKVNYVQNVTDIDDDILKRSAAAGENWRDFGNKWTEVFLSNMRDLGWIMPQSYVKATDSIPTIIKIVKNLVENNIAYEIGGTVYFDISKFENYGKLSGYNKEEMVELSRQRGANPDDPNKKNPLDFILWQAEKPGEPSWDSPWGKGRPGWHIECSSMIYDHLGERIDIHGGGEDLIYPHHESEIAQSESFTENSPFVKYWMHTSYVRYKGEKMSKSLGNLVVVSDLLKKCSPNALRWELLSHHYREQWEFEDSSLENCGKRFEALRNGIENSSPSGNPDPEFLEALNDDLNTPLALEILEKKKPHSLKLCLELLGFTF